MKKPTKYSKSWQVAETIRKYAGVSSTIYTSRIRALAVTHHKYCECECNGCTRERLSFETWEDYDKARVSQMQWVEERKAKVEALITKYAGYCNLCVEFQGDPRGCTVKLYKPDEYTDLVAYRKKTNGCEPGSLGLGVDIWK